MTRAEWGIVGAIVAACGLGIGCLFSSGPVPPWLWWVAEGLVPALTIALVVLVWRRGKRGLATVLIAILLLVEGNFSLLPYELGLKEMRLFKGYSYVSSDGRFSAGGSNCLKTNDCSWSGVERNFAEYAQSHPGVRLLRCEPIHPWQFWNWFEYATNPRWRLPYSGSAWKPSP
ncbi:MAG TPA: hypothetical protein VGX68_26015 [Thermoanaerobaculia bacterium]|jgi:hypothetical protein|nr:hypothetical protein [Thermoanaerobaculia bacterium]